MPTRPGLTNNSDETDIASLISGDSVFSIPYFQRAYKWKSERLAQLNKDLLSLVDESSDFHFLGAIIVHGRRSNPSDPDVYEVIDGQQRLTTLYIYLCAIIRVLCAKGEYAEAGSLFLRYLVIARSTPLISNAKLHPCKDDRAQLNLVINELLSDPGFAQHTSTFTFRPLPTMGSDRGPLRNNFRSAVRFFSQQTESEGVPRLRALCKALLENMSVVQIDVWDPTNGPKIFDSLNSHQEPMTTGDLVRNEIFSKVANQTPSTIEDIDQRSWQPFYGKFRVEDTSLFDSYFFPYGLIQDPNLRKSEVFARLRATWRDIRDPEDIIRQLAKYQDAFLDVACGTNLQALPPQLFQAFLSLHSANAPSSTYPFLMQLSDALKEGRISDEAGALILKLIESFLVRRALCGHEPTGLHAVFKRLWADCGGSPDHILVQRKIREHRTVSWPTGDEVKVAVVGRELYGSGVARHVLMEWNRTLGGDPPGGAPWIEHVLPENPDPEWFSVFSVDEHKVMRHRLANLLPLSREMNQGLGNKPYHEKRPVYRNDSAFKAARKFAEDYSDWTPRLLHDRSVEMSEWAVQHWPY